MKKKCEWWIFKYHNWEQYDIYEKIWSIGDKKAELHGGVLKTFTKTFTKERCSKCGDKRRVQQDFYSKTERWN